MERNPQATGIEGVSLYPGERVVYHQAPDLSFAKTSYLIFGILFAVALVGLIFLYKRSQVDKRNPRALVITNKRVLVVLGTGEVLCLPLQELVQIRAERYQSRHRLDLLPPSDARFWRFAIGCILVTRSGVELKVMCADRPKEIWSFGRYLGQALVTGTLPAPSLRAAA